jgi:hypothetical protein
LLSPQVLGLPVGKHFKLYAPNPKGSVEGEWNGKADPEVRQQKGARRGLRLDRLTGTDLP